MCQYDIDAPAQGPSSTETSILRKMKLKKGHNSHNNGGFNEYPAQYMFSLKNKKIIHRIPLLSEAMHF